MVFYRKYRPQKLADLIGQEEIAKTLTSQLVTGKIGHAYLFWGPKGTGKTSTARILAKAVNCEVYTGKTFGEPCGKCPSCAAISDGSFIDLVEIDAASNRGIDEVRDLREKVKLVPGVGKFKVYIIDEVHMLTNEAFNALLKTLEEPPRHVIFILATTEFSKLPATIVSRLMKFNFRRADKQSLVLSLSKVAKAEKIKIDNDSLMAIADCAEGSFRDAVSLLDQVGSSGNEVKKGDVLAVARLGGVDRILKFIELVQGRKLKDAVMFVDEFPTLGLDITLFVRQAVIFLEKLLNLKIGVNAENLDLMGLDVEVANEMVQKFTMDDLQRLMRLLIVTEGEMKSYPIAQIPVVLALCKYIGDDEDGVELVETKVVIEQKDLSKKQQEVASKKTGKNAKGDSVSFSEVEKNWGEFLNRVRPLNAHVFALLRATKPAYCDGEAIMLEVFYRFHKDKLEEPKIINMLDSQMEETLGRPVRLKFTLATRESSPPVTVVKSDVVEGRGEDIEKMAQEIFSK